MPPKALTFGVTGPSCLLVSLVRGAERTVMYVHAAILAESMDAQLVDEPCFADIDEEGVFVIRVAWDGSGEDSEVVIDEIRPLNALERACIEANLDLAAAVLAWLEGEWADIACSVCGRLGREHVRHTPEFGFGACPETRDPSTQ